MKVFARLMFEITRDSVGDGAAFLHSYWGDARQQIAVLIFQCRQITDNEDLGMARQRQIGRDRNASCAIDLNA